MAKMVSRRMRDKKQGNRQPKVGRLTRPVLLSGMRHPLRAGTFVFIDAKGKDTVTWRVKKEVTIGAQKKSQREVVEEHTIIGPITSTRDTVEVNRK